MLKQLYIKNYTLIDTLNIQFHPGFSVITGETGAGKSIILGAIGLLLGQRADSKSIKQGADKCVIEAHFDLSNYDMTEFFKENDLEYDANDTIICRVLSASGKSRSFVNDTPVALTTLKELGEQLVDIHSQHQNLLLQKHDFQLSVVDIIANDTKELAEYKHDFVEYHEAIRQLERLKADIEQNRQNADFLQFQYGELTNAHLIEGEQEELEQRSETMTHAEDIKSVFYEVDNVLSGESTGVVPSLYSAIHALKDICRVFPAATELAERIESAYIELKDVSGEVSGCLENVEFDPMELDTVNNRLDMLNDLQKKYHVDSTDALLALQDKLKRQLANLENSDEALQALQHKCELLKDTCERKADILTTMRKKAAKKIEKELLSRLVPLGMPNVRFTITIDQQDLGQNGHDKVAFLFSANTSTLLQPIAQVASGGEIARVMLSLKAMISGAVKLPTIIFDEIDTGVSGKIAEQMAQIMQEMGVGGRQVLSITHLPQIAALGASHYMVTKTETATGTKSIMLELSEEERIKEISQMLSGSNITDAAIQNAKELLKQ